MATEQRRMVVQIVVDSKKANKSLKNAQRDLKKTATAAEQMRRSFVKLNSALAIIGGGTFLSGMVGSFIKMVDVTKELGGRINLVAEETVGLAQAQEDLHQVSLRTYTSYDAVGALYARLGVATKDLSVSHQDLLDISETVANTLRVSGASAQEARSSMLQLSQAMASGVLSGDEYRSISENNVALMGLFAEASGKTRGELKEMSKAQEITTERMVEWIKAFKGDYQSLVANLPVTVGRAMVKLREQWRYFIVDLDKAIDGTKSLSSAIVFLANNLPQLTSAAISFTAAFAAYKLAGIAVGAGGIAASIKKILDALKGVSRYKVLIAGLTALATKGFIEQENAGLAVGVKENSRVQELQQQLANAQQNVNDLRNQLNLKANLVGSRGADTAETTKVQQQLDFQRSLVKALNEELLERQKLTAEETKAINTKHENTKQLEEYRKILEDTRNSMDSLREARGEFTHSLKAFKVLRDALIITEEEYQQAIAHLNKEFGESVVKVHQSTEAFKANKAIMDAAAQTTNVLDNTLANLLGTLDPVIKAQNDMNVAIQGASIAFVAQANAAIALGKPIDDLVVKFTTILGVLNAIRQNAVNEIKAPVVPSVSRGSAGGGGKSAAQQLAEDNERLRDSYESLKESLDPLYGIQQAYARDVELVTEAYEAHKNKLDDTVITYEDMMNTLEKLRIERDAAIESLRDDTWTKDIESSLRSFAEGFSDNFIDSILTGKSTFEEFLFTFLRGISQMIAKQLLFNALSSLAGSTNPVLGFIGGAFKGFDSGGTILPGQVGVVGEQGPELISGPANVTGREDTAKLFAQLTEAVNNMQQSSQNIRIINVQDENAEDYLGSDPGERKVMNILRRNRSAVRGLVT